MKTLILIDIQKGLTKKALYNKSFFFDTVNRAIKTFRNSGSKIIFVQHNNNHLKQDTPDWELDERLDKQPDDIIIQKKHGNAFQETDLKKILTDPGITSITIGGLVSHGCVRATCLGGVAEGFETSLLNHGHTNWKKEAKALIEKTEKELTESGVKMEEVNNL
jgi:nicotinamidase-related amidase